MKRFFCVTFSLFLLITLLTSVASAADLGEGFSAEEQQTEIIEETEAIIDDESVFEDEITEDTQAPESDSDIPADKESCELEADENKEDEETNYYTETISLDSDIEAAIFQIRDNLAFLNYGIIPLICSSVIAYLFYRFIITTF